MNLLEVAKKTGAVSVLIVAPFVGAAVGIVVAVLLGFLFLDQGTPDGADVGAAFSFLTIAAPLGLVGLLLGGWLGTLPLRSLEARQLRSVQ